MDTYSPQKLPFFPRPYPGESLYSVLCRYHVRSGNATAVKTIRQLFGGYASLSSTLLLPSAFVLRYMDAWSSACPDLRQTEFLWAHTAFSLCSLREYSFYRYIFFEDYKPAVASRKMRSGSFRQARVQHASQKIRYCPLCAAEQKKIYGESYWQIVPQLDGVEYCPAHQVRIVSTSIHVMDFRYSFHPADTVLTNSSVGTITDPIAPSPYSEIQNRPDVFVSMARCVQYLWQHLPEYSGIWFLLNRYRQLLSIPNTNDLWQSASVVREKLLQNHQVKLVNWLLSQNETVDPRYIFFSQFSLAQHAMMISLLSPSPEAFFLEESL